MRISDWSSDVCSSDLRPRDFPFPPSREKPESRARQSLASNPVRRTAASREDIRMPPPFDLGHAAAARVRSEEHTSELQSLMRISYAVFCVQKQKIQKLISYAATVSRVHKRQISQH